MSGLVLLAALLAGIVLLTPLADRLRVPQPILLLIFGLLLAFVPGLPDLASLKADLILPVVLPPLLFAATQRATAGQSGWVGRASRPTSPGPSSCRRRATCPTRSTASASTRGCLGGSSGWPS